MDGVEAVFVDLSNVAKDPLLGFSADHAALSRWDRLRAVWLRDHAGQPDFTLIADSTLPRALSATDQGRLTSMVNSGAAVVVADADTEVLARAVASSGIALSNDRYVDHRKLAGLHQARLVGWVVRGENVRLQERSLERLLSAVISARAQKQIFKELGIAEDAPELSYRWFCRDTGCRETLVAIPRFERRDPVCPSCGGFVDRGAPWQSPIWIKIMRGPDELCRFVLEDGERTFVGRGQGDDVVTVGDEEEADEALTFLAERHVELTNTEGTLHVRDNNTERGTTLRRQVKGHLGQFQPPMPVPADRTTIVGLGTKVVLGKSPFTIQIAGSRGL
ncbi:MAG: hypothetical protein F2840_15685 [Actinobacteria bacterium]|uniref:Unannotated protein n=1 Tax=freshwater metagenome TaxID=449393 RepID=A0A6J7LKS0_9ZZZZ|nr:hypothetical protein [Actinomycetota bacterium]